MAEDWARSREGVEMVSDTWVDNEVSRRVNEALGYEVVERCVHYRRKCDAHREAQHSLI